MSHSIIFEDFPTLKDDIPLGRLVPSLRSINQDHLDPDPEIGADCISVTTVDNFEAVTDHKDARTFRLSLTSFCGASKTTTGVQRFLVNGATARSYVLSQPLQQWQQMCSLPSTKAWLNRALRCGWKTYFIVGLRTITDGQLSLSGSTGTKTGSVAAISSIDVLGLRGAVVGASIGAVLGAVSDSTGNSRLSYRTEGERIYGICLRRIRLRRFFSTNSPTMLPDNVWQLPWVTRGDNDPSAVGMVEATLCDGPEEGIDDEIHFLSHEIDDEDESDEGDGE